MKTFADAIEACQSASTFDEKYNALKGIHQHHQRCIHEALNKHRRFNVKQWDEPTSYSKTDYPILIPFYELLDQLAARDLTGNAARKAVTKVMSMYTKRTARYLSRVLKKDLKCGAERATFLKIYPEIGDDLPDFDLMLAKKVDEKYTWKFPCIAEMKYDGERLVACADPEQNVVVYYSRSGRAKNYCNGLFDKDLLKLAKKVGQPIVVDGEVLGKNFQETAKAKGEKGVQQKKDLRFYAFDMMTSAEWQVKKCKVPQNERSAKLAFLIEKLDLDKVVKSESATVRNLDEVTKLYKHALDEGFEGLIIKDPEALYQWDRVRSWAKWKPVYTYDLKVVEIIRGDGKYANSCGAVRLKGTDENGRRIRTKMGTGLKDKERDWFWANRRDLIGKVIEVKAQEMTQSDKDRERGVYSLRFPVFVRVRDDKKVA